MKETHSLNINVQKVTTKLWRPQVREEATLDIISSKNGIRGYLIGGFNGDGLKQIVQMSISKQSRIIDWKLLDVENHSRLQSKFGQATCTDEHYIYISGGADL
jgi:hypothetical protein